MLCSACQEHFQHSINNLPTEELDDTFIGVQVWPPRSGADVLSEARRGCELCARICTVVSYMPKFRPSEGGTQMPPNLESIRSVQVESWVDFKPGTKRPDKIRLLFQSLDSPSEHVAHSFLQFNLLQNHGNLTLPHPIGGETSHETCFDFFAEALSTCLQTHDTCRQSITGWIPSRLIQIDTHDRMRLIERNELQLANVGRVEYFTLSHVWGNQQFLTLTNNNMADLIKQIEFTMLPKCFQDAVTVTGRLGGKYLWIDSLCIIQDSPEDWATESGLMHHTYSNGICNLAASNQSPWNRGLLCSRDPAIGAALAVDCFWEDNDRTEKTSVYPNMFHVIKEHAPLYRRGWVTQEQRLSPRTIHMAAFPIWECRKAVLSETLPSQDVCAEYGWQCAPDKLHLESFGGHPETYWLETIEDYSLCGLTKDSDKLVALGGVAKTLSQRLGNQYFAGIWGGAVNTFIRGLLWHCQVYLDGLPRETGRYEEYVAPSWSWASVDGPILAFKDPISVPLIDIVAAMVYPRNGDIFGQLHAGYIRAHGVLFPFPSINSIKNDWDSYSSEVSFDPLDLNLDDCDWRRYGHNETWFLPLALTPNTSSPANFDACGILLQRADASTATYHRVGYIVVSHEGEVAGSGWFIDRWRPPPWTMDCYSVVTIV